MLPKSYQNIILKTVKPYLDLIHRHRLQSSLLGRPNSDPKGFAIRKKHLKVFWLVYSASTVFNLIFCV